MTDEEKKRIQDAIQVIRNRANEICSIVNLKMKEEFTLLWDKFLEENREKIRVTAFANFLPQKRILMGKDNEENKEFTYSVLPHYYTCDHHACERVIEYKDYDHAIFQLNLTEEDLTIELVAKNIAHRAFQTLEEFANKSGLKDHVIEIGFLGGRIEPDAVVQSIMNIGSEVFLRVVHVFGVCPIPGYQAVYLWIDRLR